MNGLDSSTGNSHGSDKTIESIELIIEQVLETMQRGQNVDIDQINGDHPELQPVLSNRLIALVGVFSLASESEGPPTSLYSTDPLFDSTPGFPGEVCCPNCAAQVTVSDFRIAEVACQKCGSSIQLDDRVDDSTTVSLKSAFRKLGRFRLLDLIGRGGFGIVYKAYDSELQRIVAIKVPRAGSFQSEDDEQRFLREARHVARLKHRNIVPVYEIGHINDFAFIVSEFIDGATLAKLISEGLMEFKSTASIVAKIADAVAYAHEQKIVHRDLKPGNILLNHALEPFVTDFGLARADEGELTITLQGQVIGTPAYMSPEQVDGSPEASPLSDVYSLGVILYRMVAGELPFRGGKRLLMHQIRNEEPRAPRTLNEFIPRDLETIVLKAMSKDPSKRYSSAAALADDLRCFVNGDPISARPVSQFEKMRRVCRRYPVASSLATALVLMLLVTSIGGFIWAIREGHQVEKNQVALKRVDEARAFSQNQLARTLIPRGNERLLAGDNLASLPWLVAGWSLESQFADHDQADRLRFGTVVANCPRLVSVHGDDSPVIKSVISRDNRIAACAFLDGRILVWDILEDRLLVDNNEQPEITDLAISRNNRFLAASSVDNSIQIWDLENEKRLHKNKLHDDRITGVEFDNSGEMLLSTSNDCTAKIWKFLTSQPLQVYRHDKPVRQALFEPGAESILTIQSQIQGNASTLSRWTVAKTDRPSNQYTDPKTMGNLSIDRKQNKIMAITSDDRILVWEMSEESLQPMWKIGGFNDVLYSQLLRRQNQTEATDQLLVVTRDGVVRKIDGETGESVFELRTGNMAGTVAVDPSETLVAIADRGNRVSIWNIQTRSTHCPQLIHANRVTSLQFTSNGNYLLTSAIDGLAKIWDIMPRDEVNRMIPGTAYIDIAVSPDGDRLAIRNEPGRDSIKIVRTGRHEKTSEFLELSGLKQVNQVAFSPDGSELLTGSVDGVAQILDLRDGHALTPEFVADDPIWQIRYSLDGNLIIADTLPELLPLNAIPRLKYPDAVTVFVWDRKTGQVLHEFIHDNRVKDLILSPDGRFLATTCDDMTVRIWNLKTGEDFSGNLSNNNHHVHDCAFSQDGNTLLIGSGQFNVTNWDVVRRATKPMPEIRHNATPFRVCFHPTTGSPVTGSNDGKVNYWTFHNNAWQARSLATYGAMFDHLEFDSSGRYLITSTINPVVSNEDSRLNFGAIQIWNSQTREMAGPLFTIDENIEETIFDPKGRFVVAAGKNGNVTIWWLVRELRDVDTAQLLAEVLSGHRIDENSDFVPLPASQFLKRWDRLKQRQPETTSAGYSPYTGELQ